MAGYKSTNDYGMVFGVRPEDVDGYRVVSTFGALWETKVTRVE